MEDAEREAAGALARADPLAALNALGEHATPHARALRGIALAQLQELEAAERELRAAAAALDGEPVFRVRALAALAEVAAARNQLGTALDALAGAATELEELGDRRNAAWTRLVRVRLLLLVGEVDEARAELAAAGRAAEDGAGDPVLDAARRLAQANASVRELSAAEALASLDGALAELGPETHPLLAGELETHRAALARPLALVHHAGRTASVALPELAAVLRGRRLPDLGDEVPARWLVVDRIAQRALFGGEDAVELAGKEASFALLDALAEAWPEAVATSALLERLFESGAPADRPGERDELEEAERDRLRTLVVRLRAVLPGGADVEALGNAWRLALPDGVGAVTVELAEGGSALEALLSDGEPWAARDLALALGCGPRTIQRALARMSESGLAKPLGQARARRWVAAGAAPGIASRMLLVSLLAPT